MNLSEKRQATRMAFEERAGDHLADTYGDEPFKVYTAVDSFAEDLGIDSDVLLHMPAQVEAHRAIKAVMAQRPNGYPRYLYVGGAYQRTEAVPAEKLADLRHQARATAEGFTKRDQWLAEREVAKTGGSLDELAKERKDAIRDLEDSFAAA